MSPLVPVADLGHEHPVAVGTVIRVDPSVSELGPNLLAGGSPWRLLRLSPGAASAVAAWRVNPTVTAGQGALARTLAQVGFIELVHPPDSRTYDVEVVIPVHDDAARLDQLLIQLAGLSITVVDDGSHDRNEVSTVCARHGARLLHHDQSHGPAAARNAGLRATVAPYVWFVDCDVIIDDATRTLAQLRSHFVDPLVAAVAPRVVGASGPRAMDRFEARFSPLDMGTQSARVMPTSRVAYVPSASLLVRRSSLGEAFDPTMSVGEDVDLIWRLTDHGWTVRYDASVTVRHAARPSWRESVMQRVGYGRSATALALRHGDRAAPVRVDAWTLGVLSTLLARQARVAMAIVAFTRDRLSRQLPDSIDNRTAVAHNIVMRGVTSSIGPLARSTVRGYAPILYASMLSKRLRRPAAVLLTVGTLWRWRGRTQLVVRDLPFALGDDLAYSVGVWLGAFEARSPQAITPHVRLRTDGLGALRRSRADTV